MRHAEAKGIAFRRTLDLGRSRCYLGDAARLAQVMGILLGNAVKFTERGSVTFSAAREGGDFVFGVADTGIGMSPEEVERLFRPFEQSDGSSTRRHGGMGLGLALAERLVALMGGSIRVESQVGQGTTFAVRLPLAEADGAVETVAALLAEDKDFSI